MEGDHYCHLCFHYSHVCVLLSNGDSNPCYFHHPCDSKAYKNRLYNVIDLLMLGIMFMITILSWTILDASLDIYTPNTFIAALIEIKIILLYLPLVLLVGIIILRLLHRYDVLPERLQRLSSDIEKPIAKDSATIVDQQCTTADEDLFTRTAELNSPPQTFVLSAIQEGFELQTRETGQNSIDESV